MTTPSFLLYHLSPSSRRKQITRYGLRPGSWSTDRAWRAPYVAFADSPSLAWALSGMTGRGAEHPRWDLWTVRSDRLDSFQDLRGVDGLAEIRVFDRVYKRHIWYVATRERENA